MMDMVREVTQINGQLGTLVESNSRQDAALEAHRETVKQTLAEHKEAVGKSIDRLDKNVVDLKSFMDKTVAIGGLLLFIIPTVLTTIEVTTLFNGEAPMAEVRQS